MPLKDFVLLSLFGIYAFQDILQKKISLCLIIVGIISGLGFSVYEWVYIRSFCLSDIIYLFPGILLIVLSCFSSQIGLGDGLTVLIVGLFYPSLLSLVILVLAFFSLFIFSLCSYVLGKVKKNSKIPFAPFLLIGLFGGLWMYA